MALTVTKVTRLNAIKIWKPDPGNVFVDIEAVIENTARDQAPYNPLYFKVKDSDGFEYNHAIASVDPSLKSGDLAKGEKVRGHVAFEVKSSAKGLVLAFEPMVLFGDYKEIRIALGQ
jgi:hypothetical protein